MNGFWMVIGLTVGAAPLSAQESTAPFDLPAEPSQPAVEAPAWGIDEVLGLHLDDGPAPLARWHQMLAWLEAQPDHALALDLADAIGTPPYGLDLEASVLQLTRLRERLSDTRLHARFGEWLAELEWRSAASGMPLDLGEDLYPTWMADFWFLGPLGALTDPEPLWSERGAEGDPEVQLKSSYRTDWGEEVTWQAVRRSPRKATVPGDQQPYHAGGSVYFLSGASLEAGDGFLDLQTGDSVRVLWNGQVVFFRKTGGHSSAGSWFRIPVRFDAGINTLLVVTDGNRYIEFGARLLDDQARAIQAPGATLEQLLQASVERRDGEEPTASARGEVIWDPRSALGDSQPERLLAAWRALHRGRPDIAALAEAPEDAAWTTRWMRLRHAALEQAGTYLPEEVQRQRLIALEEELAAQGGVPIGVEQSRIHRLLREDKPLEAQAAWQALSTRAELTPSLTWTQIWIADALDEHGWLAHQAILDACEAWPEIPEFREALVQAYARRGNAVLAREHSITALRLGSRDEAMVRQAAQGLASVPSDERRAWLLATLERWAHLHRSDRSYEWLLQDTLVTLGQRDLAIERAKRLAESRPNALEPWNRLLSLVAGGGAGAGDGNFDMALAQLKRLEPATELVLEYERHEGLPVEADSFFRAFAPDAEFAWQAADGLEKSSTVEVLDSGMIYLYPDGSRVGRVMTITKAEDRTGTEELHEIPASGIPLLAQVRKADGSLRQPVMVQGAWAMPSLDPGDAVEMQFETRTQDAWGAPVDLGIWRFASAQRPFALSRYVVYVPKGLPVEVRTRNFVGSHVTEPWGNGTVHVLTTERQARVEQEPLMPSDVEVLPVARFAADRTTLALEQEWRAFLQVSQDLPLELERGLDAWVAELPGEASAEEKAQWLFDRLHDELVEFDGSANPAEVWFAKRGQPILLFAALLERAKVPFTWGLMTQGQSPELDPNPVRLFENLELSAGLILRIEGDNTVLWQVPPQRKGVALGTLPDGTGGAKVMLLEEDGTREETLPRRGLGEPWKNFLHLDLTVQPDGSAQVVGTWSIQTLDGMLLRRQIAQAPAQQRDAFVRQVVARFAPGVDLSDFTVVDRDQRGAPIQVRFEGTRPDFLESTPTGFKADLRLPNAGLSTGLGPSQRNWPLAARFLLKDRFEVSVTLPEGWSVVGGPQPFVEEREGFLHRLDIAPEPGEPWRLEKTFLVRGMWLAPDEVPRFLERAAELEREEARPLLIQPLAAETPPAPTDPEEAQKESSEDSD